MTTHTPNHKLEKQLEEFARSSDRTSIISLVISLTALLVACTSIFYAHRDYVGDTDWQKEQIEELKKSRKELELIKQNILKPKADNSHISE